LVDLAVKGVVRISELKPGRFQLTNLCLDRPPQLHLTEGVLFSQLLGHSSCVTLEGFNAVAIEQAKDTFKKALRQQCESHYVKPNRTWIVAPVLLMLVCALIITLTSFWPMPSMIALVLTGALAAILRRPFPGVLRSVRAVPFRWLGKVLAVVIFGVLLYFISTKPDRGVPPLSPLLGQRIRSA
jgi:hypothetical protein